MQTNFMQEANQAVHALQAMEGMCRRQGWVMSAGLHSLRDIFKFKDMQMSLPHISKVSNVIASETEIRIFI